MRRLMVVSLLLVFVVSGVARTDGKKKQIKWIDSFADGLKAAKEAKKPVFIDFSAEW